MGTRTKLFASAAFPLLSLSLALQPAHAGLMQASSVQVGTKATDRGASFQVAQAEAEPADGEQDPHKRKKPQGEEQAEPPKAEQKQEKPAAEPEAPKPPKAAAEPEAPKPPKAAAEPEAPKPPKPEPAAPKAEQPEAPQPPKREKPKPAAEEAAPAAEAPAPEPKAEQPEAVPVKPKAAAEPAAPAAEGQPEAAPKPPKHNQKPANSQEEPAQPQAAPGEPEAAPAKPPKPAKPAAEAPAPAAPDAEAPAAPKPPAGKPPVKPAANAPKPAAGDEQPAPAASGEKPAAAAGEKPAPVAPDAPPAPPAEGKPPVPAEAPAKTGEAAPQAAPSTAGEQVSPAELEKRKKIAENPAAAGAGAGPVILPVQNGTAVLDSDKESARHRNNGQPGQPPAPGGQAQPVPGQAPDGQRPPAPENVRAPTSDADSQRAPDGKRPPPVKIEAATSEQGRQINQRPDFVAPQGAQIGDRQDNRVIINFGGDTFVRHDDTQRFTRDGERPTYEQLPRDRYRETIGRPDGTRIVTIRNRYGDIIQRSRVDQDGREYVLFYSPELENRPDQDDYYRDPGDQLPPMRLRIPLNQYIIDTSEDQNQDYYDFLRKPPVEPVERVYSLNEVRYSARIRDKVRRIDLDTVTFATGSADIPMAQAKTLRGIADAIGQIIKKNPSETFLIEGHTDAVGSAQSNLILSDQRAESVANVLTDVYGIPPENLATQGYGEQYLKINTQGPEQENRRVTIRRVTALVRPVASK